MAEVKKASSTPSIVNGIVTVLLGFYTCFASEHQLIAFGCLVFTMIFNLVIHAESYYTNKKLGKVQGGVLTITVIELVFTVLLIIYSIQLFTGDINDFWTTLMIIYSCYLVSNGASLIAIPLGFAIFSGWSAIVTGAFVFVTASSWGVLAAIALGISFIVNGGERVVMAMMSRKAK